MANQPTVDYTCEDDTLHIFTFHDNSHEAAREYMQLQNDALETWIQNGRIAEPFRIIIDISQSGLFPISHTLSYSLTMLNKYEKIPNRYFAYITDNRNDLLILRQLAEGGGKDWENKRRIFAPDALDEAKAWLLAIT